MQGILDWLAALPPGTLYLLMFLAAAIKNVLPPLPFDTIVAFGCFLAGRGTGSIVAAFAVTWAGNLSGAAVMYGAGKKYGARRMDRQLLGEKGDAAESRLEELYNRYGLAALFVSRFIPGVRAVVPPFAGAFRLPFVRSMVVIGIASGVWYGVVSYFAFSVGGNWSALQSRGGDVARTAMIVVLGIVTVGVIGWVIHRRRTAAR